jgi:hypothetical protein
MAPDRPQIAAAEATRDLTVIVLAVAAVAVVAVLVIQAVTSLLIVLAVIVGALAVLGSVGLVLLLRYQGRRRQAMSGTVIPARPVPRIPTQVLPSAATQYGHASRARAPRVALAFPRRRRRGGGRDYRPR